MTLGKVSARVLNSRKKKLDDLINGRRLVSFEFLDEYHGDETRLGFLVRRSYPKQGYFIKRTSIQIPLKYIQSINLETLPATIKIAADECLMYQGGIPEN